MLFWLGEAEEISGFGSVVCCIKYYFDFRNKFQINFFAENFHFPHNNKISMQLNSNLKLVLKFWNAIKGTS